MQTPEPKTKYNKQRNNCVSLIRKAKRNYYESLNLNNICDKKNFGLPLKLAENIVLS